MLEPLTLKDNKEESRIFARRLYSAFGFLLLLSLLLVGRFFHLQVVQHDLHATLSDKNRIQVQPLAPNRGLIFDTNGNLLADNEPSINLTITRERVDDLKATFSRLKAVLELTDEEIDAFRKRLNRQQRPFEPVPVRFRLTPEEIARVSVDLFELPGVGFEAKLVRHYPQGELMAHAVGSVRRIDEEDARRLDPVAYSGTDHIGKMGVEKFYERDLLGKVGNQRVETNARGKIMKRLDSTLPTPGKDLTLHLDTGLQLAASRALADRRGAVVAVEPATGGILALLSKPGYDPNLFVTGIAHDTYADLRDSRDTPLFNRAVRGQYEPGSTIKPLLGLAGLATGVVDEDYAINDPGWFKLPGDDRLYRDWNWKSSAAGGHGVVNISKAVYRSCNVYFYGLALLLGIDRMEEHLARFGFGTNTTLDIPEAETGLLPSKAWKRSARGEPWYPGDTLNMGIGQGDMLVTPLQLATAMTVIANRGRWVPPRMLKSGSDLPQAGIGPGDVDGVPAPVWDLIIDGMRDVVHRGNRGYGENGTAWAYIGRDIPYRMAGKSGTAQVVGIRQGEVYEASELDERLRNHAWFVAFAPVEEPRIAVAVLVENGGGGSKNAAPVARAVIDHHLLDKGSAPIQSGGSKVGA